eukprot:TRINITY_DN3996_c0_g1_i3.p1 TRINITY_DN3996_c0_g1~~TRINITY_DN3996_c0_g1_i3.p1  ORF type:complete len:143 (+),score=24.29 TRINITY_DN3996_c0_g1_i3:306-734(+)
MAVGFGEQRANSVPGRVVLFLTSIWGWLVLSILVSVISDKMKHNPAEQKLFAILEGKQLRQKWKSASAGFIGNRWKKFFENHLRGDNAFNEARHITALKHSYRTTIFEGIPLEEEFQRNYFALKGKLEELKKTLFMPNSIQI